MASTLSKRQKQLFVYCALGIEIPNYIIKHFGDGSGQEDANFHLDTYIDQTIVDEIKKANNYQVPGDPLSYSVNIGMTPLCIACLNGHSTIVRQLLGRISNIDVNMKSSGENNELGVEWTPLEYAFDGKHIDVLIILKNKGAKIMKDKLYVFEGRKDVLRLIEQYKEDELPSSQFGRGKKRSSRKTRRRSRKTRRRSQKTRRRARKTKKRRSSKRRNYR